MGNWDRRRVLRSALAGTGAALWPAGGLLAQGSAASLLRAKKEALVIGNGRYRDAPLRNPVNDATGIAGELKKAGFAVTLGLELTRAEMQSAISSYGQRLAAGKAVGLFYFAGHGAQLAWRNYLIPVDGQIASIEELRDRGVDVNTLIDGIRRAGNPMNLIILDACRDNPFGSLARIEQRGLSQLDAPPGTLLAYATAPGNTAIDGDGANGLYTESLLREMTVPEAKVEDVFKRVRLAVRRRSNGLQIPWESTSLEEDFWFVPPRELKKLAEAEIEREFKEELAAWERAQKAAAPDPIEEYLRRYPSGRFTELAQLQLDRTLAKLGEKKVEVVSAPENPYTKGTVAANTAYKIGDFYSYRQSDLLTKLEMKRQRPTVTAITETEVHFSAGRFVTDLLGNTLRSPNGAIWAPNQTVPTEFAVGRRWSTRFRIIPPQGGDTVVDLTLRVADRERITVPAGTFNAFRIEARGYQIGQSGQDSINVAWDWKTWYAPDAVRRPILAEWFNRAGGGKILRAERFELMEYRQS
jgi:hypothetical protein